MTATATLTQSRVPQLIKLLQPDACSKNTLESIFDSTSGVFSWSDLRAPEGDLRRTLKKRED